MASDDKRLAAEWRRRVIGAPLETAGERLCRVVSPSCLGAVRIGYDERVLLDVSVVRNDEMRPGTDNPNLSLPR